MSELEVSTPETLNPLVSPTEFNGFEPEEPTHYAYSRYLRETFGGKTYKVVVASGLTCPTRDGTIDKGGCTFCDVRGSSSYFGKVGRGKEIHEQIETRLPGMKKRFHASHYIAYFQSYTNTYSDIDYLREIYTAALSHPEIEGLAIGTRPDCIPDNVIDLLQELAQEHYISLELGIQSFEEPTLTWIRRGHDGACALDALKRLRERAPDVQTCAHLIFGCPTDSAHAARDAALILNETGVKGVKLHQLMVLQKTKMAEEYLANPFKTVTIEEYAEIVAEFIEHLKPGIYLERLSALATHSGECIAPEWSRYRWDPINRIREILRAKGVRQGKRLV